MALNITKINDDSLKINTVYFKKVYRLATPYWFRRTAWKSWLALGLTILIVLLSGMIGGYLTYETAKMTNLQLARDHGYWAIFIWVTFIGFVLLSFDTLSNLLSSWFKLEWRKWLSQYFIKIYMKDRVYYDITYKEDIDNPDQRIQEHVAQFCEALGNIPSLLISAVVMISVQIGVLMFITPVFLWSNILVSIISSVILYFLALPLIKKTWLETIAKANFRTSLLNVREYAENIAFYRGENRTLLDIQQKVSVLFKISKNILIYNSMVEVVQNLLRVISSVLPVLILVPLFFAGQIDYGKITQAIVSAMILTSGISLLYSFVQLFLTLAPAVIRLSEIQDKPLRIQEERARRPFDQVIQFFPHDDIEIQHLSLKTPGGEQQLVQNLKLTVKPGDHLLITGRTGVGKSSLLRVMAGLWDHGVGRVGLPSTEDLLFFPQRPYMFNANLRAQLIYPAISSDLTDTELHQILARVGQPLLIERYDGLDTIRNWKRELSLGEQQCISMARLLIHRPRYAFLDEASSALDGETEAKIYHEIAQSGTTIISIGHRSSIVRYHVHQLDLIGAGQWELLSIAKTEIAIEVHKDPDHIIVPTEFAHHSATDRMESRVTTQVDRHDLQLNRLFFLRLLALLKPYWTRSKAWHSWLVGILVASITILSSIAAGFFSYLTAEQVNALVAKQESAYWHFFILLTGFSFLQSFAFIFSNFIRQFLNLDWQKWLSKYFAEIYLSDRTYYEIVQDDEIDNPDQRIQGEIEPFCQNMTRMFESLLGAFANMSIQIGIVWSISSELLYFVLVYAILHIVLTLYLNRPVIKKSFYVEKSEADFRYSLLHIRENAENIAFYRGERSEIKQIFIRLKLTINYCWKLALYNEIVNFILRTFSIILVVVPAIILVPMYFERTINFGQIAQVTLAAGIIISNFGIVSNLITQLSNVVANVVRLSEIMEKLITIRSQKVSNTTQSLEKLRTKLGDFLKFDNVNLKTPSGEVSLVQDLNLEIRAGDHYIIIGRTGVGKSSLLRALAGIWNNGTGLLQSPPENEQIFLPQRPYLMEGTLRSQLIYPEISTDLSDEQLQRILDTVQLGHLTTIYEGLETIMHWGRILSLGEQQRIGFARILIKPRRFVFLDEATSAVDEHTEHLLYTAILATGATLISVCHKKSAWQYHQYYLKLLAGGQYEKGLLNKKEVVSPVV